LHDIIFYKGRDLFSIALKTEDMWRKNQIHGIAQKNKNAALS
jgi:hypothetical protein